MSRKRTLERMARKHACSECYASPGERCSPRKGLIGLDVHNKRALLGLVTAHCCDLTITQKEADSLYKLIAANRTPDWEAYGYECPTCKVPVGKSCVSVSGVTKGMAVGFHQPRRDRAAREKQTRMLARGEATVQKRPSTTIPILFSSCKVLPEGCASDPVVQEAESMSESMSEKISRHLSLKVIWTKPQEIVFSFYRQGSVLGDFVASENAGISKRIFKASNGVTLESDQTRSPYWDPFKKVLYVRNGKAEDNSVSVLVGVETFFLIAEAVREYNNLHGYPIVESVISFPRSLVVRHKKWLEGRTTRVATDNSVAAEVEASIETPVQDGAIAAPAETTVVTVESGEDVSEVVFDTLPAEDAPVDARPTIFRPSLPPAMTKIQLPVSGKDLQRVKVVKAPECIPPNPVTLAPSPVLSLPASLHPVKAAEQKKQDVPVVEEPVQQQEDLNTAILADGDVFGFASEADAEALAEWLKKNGKDVELLGNARMGQSCTRFATVTLQIV